jgi:hypothetical protein
MDLIVAIQHLTKGTKLTVFIAVGTLDESPISEAIHIEKKLTVTIKAGCGLGWKLRRVAWGHHPPQPESSRERATQADPFLCARL